MLTHVNDKQQPQMVDVGNKESTKRRATAQGRVFLPKEVMKVVSNGEIMAKKGPVLQTAIIAGTQAVKKTSDLIPFCHNINIEGCDFDLQINPEGYVDIQCTVKCSGKTGVEMEALTGVSVASLTVYDMCKALSHDITIGEIKLNAKTGGKSDFER